MITIGSFSLHSRCILAPLAGVSDFPFRMLNRSFGCELAFVEMINARALGGKSRRTRQMLSSVKDDRPLGVQLLGCEPKYILRALGVIRKYEFDILDFNAACPAKKVVRRGEGAALLKEPEKLVELLKLVVRESPVPVTVKIRSGWDKETVNCRQVALAAEDAGVHGICIHGRTRMQGYSGSVDYAAIREVKRAVRIPVIASGDIWSAEHAQKMFDETGCDAVAVARGSLGNPWIFPQIEHCLKKGAPVTVPSLEEVLAVMERHLRANAAFYGERNGVIMFRKFFAWYSKGWRKIRPLREKASRVKTFDEMLALIRECR